MYEILRNCHNINLFTEKRNEDKIAEGKGNDLICSNIHTLRPKEEEEVSSLMAANFYKNERRSIHLLVESNGYLQYMDDKNIKQSG
jgi:hypothetical protein